MNNPNNTSLILSSTLDTKKVFKKAFNFCLKLTFFFIAGGIFLLWIGNYLFEPTSYYRRYDESDMYMLYFFMLMGGISILLGFVVLVFPFLIKSKTKKYHISIYNDRIIGKGLIHSQDGLSGQMMDFQEKSEDISSVSTANRSIVVNMKDGRRIDCLADNYEDIAEIIRTHLIK